MKYSLLLLSSVILLFQCSSPNNENNITTSLDSLLAITFPEGEPGGAVLVMKGNEIIFSKGYGLADMETEAKITPATLFNLGSISKTFVANAILILQFEGKLSVEDSMDKYFPGFKDKQIAQKVKIKHLLTHTSGLPDNRPIRKDSVFYLTAKDVENWYPVTQADSLEFEPGTHYQYSNPAFNGLALIVEQVSGMKWQAFIENNIFKQAGMKTSTITDGEHPKSGVAHAYLNRNGQWIEKDYGEEPTFAAAGNGGVWSSMEELSLYEQSLKQGIFLPESIVTRSREVTNWGNWEQENSPFIGWSWFIGKTPDGLKTVGHTGSQGGFLCNYVTVPEKDMLFVILCNTPRDVDGLTTFITQWLMSQEWLE